MNDATTEIIIDTAKYTTITFVGDGIEPLLRKAADYIKKQIRYPQFVAQVMVYECDWWQVTIFVAEGT